jgi:hypothetical protein
MYYLVIVDDNGMAVDGANDMLWNGSDEDGKLGGSVRKMKALTVKMDTDTDW